MQQNGFQRNNPTAIGRAKTVIVFEGGVSPVALVSEIVVRISADNKGGRLVFRGPVHLEARGLKHLHSVILPLVDRITEQLGVPGRDYEVSVVNIGAAASLDRGVEISGFSSDLPMFIALLSASLQVGLRQDLISTGHVASLGGDLAPVRGIPLKLDAALASPRINGFAFPELEMDRSLQVLTPIEYQSAKESLLRHKGDLKIYPLGDVSDALRIFLTDPSIVLGSLKTGFFSLKAPPGEAQDPIGRTVELFVGGNEKRFWDALGHTFMNRMVKNSRLLLQTYVDFHLKNQCYPERFGEQLFRMVVSLPPSTRTLDDLFPLISPEFCIQLTQHAQKNDMEDVRKLYKALFGDGFGERPISISAASDAESHEHDTENALFERLLAELSKENLAKKIGHPFDNARGSYATDSVTVKDGFEFNDAITSFYGHIFRHMDSPEGNLKRSALTSEAIELVRAAFARKGGYNAALAEGKHGINGGMRLIFDSMTEHLKQEKMKKYANMMFKVSIDPLDQNAKIRLMKVFMERIGPQLPADLRGKSSEQLAFHWEEVIHSYSESLDRVSELLKIL